MPLVRLLAFHEKLLATGAAIVVRSARLAVLAVCCAAVCHVGLAWSGFGLSGFGWSGLGVGDLRAAEPADEPLRIAEQPQFVFDNYVIENRWAIKYKTQALRRVFHAPRKHPANPVISGEGGYCNVLRDADSGTFRMWYQDWQPSPVKGRSGSYAIAYAESSDGLEWNLPRLGLHAWEGTRDNNIVWLGRGGRRASSPFLLDLPPRDQRDYRYVMLYREHDGMHVIGSRDGIHWDGERAARVSPIHSDTQNAIVWDPRRERYVMFCRAKHLYRTFRGDVLDTGASRRVARMSHPRLWEAWEDEPQTILIPDEIDGRDNFHFFYGMPTRYHGGVYWGFLWPFRMNDNIHTELAVSRDGIHFWRHPERPQLVERGDDTAWDRGMVFADPHWVEVGDEWWIYYTGWDGPHGTTERTPGVGLCTIRKEGFLGVRGPRGGGVLSTRQILWDGDQLLVNADARGGELRVRVTDERRKPLDGFDYDDCRPLTGDSVAAPIRWGDDTSLATLRGQVIRLEFLLRSAELFTFRSRCINPH